MTDITDTSGTVVHSVAGDLLAALVEDNVGLRKSAIYERIKAGSFPKPVKSERVNLWVEAEVDAYIEQLVESQRKGEGE